MLNKIRRNDASHMGYNRSYRKQDIDKVGRLCKKSKNRISHLMHAANAASMSILLDSI